MAASAARVPVPASRPAAKPKPAPPAASPTRASQSGTRPERLPIAEPAVRLAKKTSRTPGAIGGLPGGGEPMSPAVREAIEQSLNVDLKSVRVHTDSRAQSAAEGLSARAITYGPHIFLGRGESPTDIGLMAHETAHVVQQQGAPMVQGWLPGRTDSYEREAHQASSAVLGRQEFTVSERTGGPHVQRLGISDALDYFAGKANLIPGFRMLTVILGVNPINMSRVERNAANIIRALLDIIPGGALITQALDNHGVLDKVGKWVEQQIKTLGLVGSVLKDALTEFLGSLGWRDIFDLGGVWERAKRIFTEPIERIWNFAKGLVAGIIKFIKDAILRPLAKLAERTRGYDLLKAILGEDPVTGDPYPRTAETLIGGFMKLIGEEEVWNNIKKANAVARAWAWFQGGVKSLVGFVKQIPKLFIKAFQSLELADIVLLPRAFLKVASVFGGFIKEFISWAGNAVWTLLQIIFEVLMPGAIPYLKKAGAAFKTILRNPVGFVGNLVKAAKLGFQQFAAKIGMHLKNSLIQWITGALAGANIYIPQSLEIRELIKFVLSVLGLTWQNIRQKLVKVIGEPAVKALEIGFDIVVTLVREGPAAAWEKIKEQLSNLKEMVMEGIMSFVTERIVQAAVTKLLSMLSPAGAFIQAIIAIYNTVMFFIERLKQIIQVAMAFIDSISAIARGVIAAAANRVEQTLAGLLTLVISFLARLVGLGKVSDAVVKIINKLRAPIDKAIDKVIDWIVTMGKKFVGAVKKGVSAVTAWWKSRKDLTVEGEKHSLFFKGEDKTSNLHVASEEKSLGDFLDERQKTLNKAAKKDKKIQAAIDDIRALQKKIRGLIAQRKPPAPDKPDPVVDKKIASHFDSIASILPVIFKGSDWGTEDNPVLMTEYPKKALSLYRPLFLGPRITRALQQSILQAKMSGGSPGKAKAGWKPYDAEISPGKLDAWILLGGRIQRFEPFRQKAWPWKPPEADSATLGIADRFIVQTGSVFKYQPGEGTPGGALLNKSLKHFGYQSRIEGTDGDHVLETQLIGVTRANTIQNMWPLLQNQNRHGLHLKNTPVENVGDPSLKIKTLDDARKKKKQMWVMIKKTRDISS